MGSIGPTELLLVLGVLVLLFGARRIPELATGLGRGIAGFRKAVRGEEESPPAPEDKPGASP